VAQKKHSNGQKTASGNRGTSPSPADVREQKRAEFSGKQSRSPLVWIVPLAVIVALAAAAAVLLTRGEKQSYAETAPATAGADVTIPVSGLKDGTAHFFSSDVGGTTVKYFVIAAPDGTLRTAFDACQVCYAAKKGYTQKGDAMQCNNCGRVFPTAQIDVQHGGCNPGPIEAEVKGGNLVVPYSQLEAGTPLFQ
jgi:uncharacterized membrane protein